MAYGKVGNVPIDELNGETSVHRGVCGGHRWGEGARVVGSRPSVRRSQACVGGGWLDTEERLLTLGDVEGDGKGVENERKEDKGADLPLGCHDGRGSTVSEGMGVGEKRERIGSFNNIQEPRTHFGLGRHPLCPVPIGVGTFRSIRQYNHGNYTRRISGWS